MNYRTSIGYLIFNVLGLTLLMPQFAVGGQPPRVLQQAKVYSEPGRFGGWPANHGIWSCGQEILVGFSRGFSKDNGKDFHYHLDRDRPEDFVLARSKDGGVTWLIEEPKPLGIISGSRGARHAAMPDGLQDQQPVELRESIRFTHPDFAMIVRMQSHLSGTTQISISYDRGKTWRGPYALPLFGFQGVMGRTDYIVNGPEDCLLFLTVTKTDGSEGRPVVVRTVDGGRTWSLWARIGDELPFYAVMPSSVRISATNLVTAVRVRNGSRKLIEAFASHDDGRSWSSLGTPETEIGEGNPPHLVRLADGRLALTYGVRAKPFPIIARLSRDEGKTWTEQFVVRGNGGSQDVGYPRSVVRSDGNIVTVYAFQEPNHIDCNIEATIWNPGQEP